MGSHHVGPHLFVFFLRFCNPLQSQDTGSQHVGPTFFRCLSSFLGLLPSKDTGSHHVGPSPFPFFLFLKNQKYCNSTIWGPIMWDSHFSIFLVFDRLQSKDTVSHHVGPHVFTFLSFIFCYNHKIRGPIMWDPTIFRLLFHPCLINCNQKIQCPFISDPTFFPILLFLF